MKGWKKAGVIKEDDDDIVVSGKHKGGRDKGRSRSGSGASAGSDGLTNKQRSRSASRDADKSAISDTVARRNEEQALLAKEAQILADLLVERPRPPQYDIYGYRLSEEEEQARAPAEPTRLEKLHSVRSDTLKRYIRSQPKDANSRAACFAALGDLPALTLLLAAGLDPNCEVHCDSSTHREPTLKYFSGGSTTLTLALVATVFSQLPVLTFLVDKYKVPLTQPVGEAKLTVASVAAAMGYCDILAFCRARSLSFNRPLPFLPELLFLDYRHTCQRDRYSYHRYVRTEPLLEVVERKKMTPLMVAIACQQPAAFDYLVNETNADVHFVSDFTAAHVAALRGNVLLHRPQGPGHHRVLAAPASSLLATVGDAAQNLIRAVRTEIQARKQAAKLRASSGEEILSASAGSPTPPSPPLAAASASSSSSSYQEPLVRAETAKQCDNSAAALFYLIQRHCDMDAYDSEGYSVWQRVPKALRKPVHTVWAACWEEKRAVVLRELEPMTIYVTAVMEIVLQYLHLDGTDVQWE